MAVMQRVVKPRTQRAKRALEAREPKSVESAKRALLVRGHSCSEMVLRLLRDLHALKRPHSELLARRHDPALRPFEDQAASLEKMAAKEDAALFAFGNSNKKRPGENTTFCFLCRGMPSFLFWKKYRTIS